MVAVIAAHRLLCKLKEAATYYVGMHYRRILIYKLLMLLSMETIHTCNAHHQHILQYYILQYMLGVL